MLQLMKISYMEPSVIGITLLKSKNSNKEKTENKATVNPVENVDINNKINSEIQVWEGKL